MGLWPYGHEHFKPKSCGGKHAWCKVCRPDLLQTRRRDRKLTPQQQERILARGYVPHPTKTMWERHTEMHNIHPRLSKPNEHGLSIILGESGGNAGTKIPQEAPSDLKPVEQVIKEVSDGRDFTNDELRHHFGFDRAMIFKFRRDQERIKRWFKLPEEARKRKEDKVSGGLEREKRIIEMRIEQSMSYKQIAKVEGISNQRVSQILQKAEKKYEVVFTKRLSELWKGDKPPVLLVAVRCRYCKKIMEVPEDEKDVWRNGFCNEHRVSPLIWSFIEQGADWYSADENGRERIRYHFDPNRKKMARIHARRWREKAMQDPVKRARMEEVQRRATATYLAKIKAQKEAERLAKIRPFIEVPDKEDGD